MAHPFVATMIDGGLEGCGPSQPWPAVNQHHFTAPTERTPSRESASNGPSVRGNDVRWRPGGLRSLAAVAGRKLNTGFTAPTEHRSRAHPLNPVLFLSPQVLFQFFESTNPTVFVIFANIIIWQRFVPKADFCRGPQINEIYRNQAFFDRQIAVASALPSIHQMLRRYYFLVSSANLCLSNPLAEYIKTIFASHT